MIDYIYSLFQEWGTALRLPASFVVLECIGTLAGAVSGVRLSAAKQFDLFGAFIVGTATAVGGGTIRDLILGLTPFWMTNPIYLGCCFFGLFWVIIFRKVLVRQDNTWFLFDCIGLSLFNAIGIEKTLALGLPYWAAICMGCVTGAGGGVMRDVLMNEVPLVFRKEIYAMAAIVGGLVYVGCHSAGWKIEACALISSIVVIVIRMLAVKYHWEMPKMKAEGSPLNEDDKTR